MPVRRVTASAAQPRPPPVRGRNPARNSQPEAGRAGGRAHSAAEPPKSRGGERMLPAIRPRTPVGARVLRRLGAAALAMGLGGALLPTMPGLFGRPVAATLGVTVSGNHLV